MYRPLTLFIGLRYIFSKNNDSFGRFISWLSMLGLMLGSMALIIVLSVMNGLERKMQTSLLRFLPQAVVTSDDNKLNSLLYTKESLRNLRGVDNILPLTTGDVILQSSKNIAIAQLMGVSSDGSSDPIEPFVFQGQLSSLTESKYQLIVGSTLAEKLQLQLGDKIRLIATNVGKLTPIGRVPSQRIFRVSGFFKVNKDVEQSFIFTNINDAAKLFNYSDGEITGWRLILTNPLLIGELTHQTLPMGLHFNDWRSERGELFNAVKLEKRMMGLLISLIVIVAFFNIITSSSLMLIEKQNEVAILKTLGLSNNNLVAIFIVQGATAGIIGTLMGTLLGIFAALNLSHIMTYLHLSIAGIVLPTLIDPVQISTIATTLITISLLVTIYPSLHATKIYPAEILRHE